MPVNFAVKAAVTVALTAANMALTMTRKIEGPRLDELKFSGGDYGAPLPMVWGLRRMDVPIFWAEDLREVRRRRKTKGGKFNEYTYYGTWAVALAGHEIEGVRRIWFDTHLVYDLSGAGPVTPFDFGSNSTGNVADYITTYTGTETQDPDPRMQATVEAEFGEGSCPAYRGTAYVVFKDIPLEKLGNRIPQVSVEIAGAASPAYPVSTTPALAPGLMGWRMFSPDYSLMLHRSGTGGEFSVFDVAARTEISSGTAIWDQNPHLRSDGTIISRLDNTLAIFDLFGNFTGTFFTFTGSAGVLDAVVYDGNGVEHRLVEGGDFWFDEVQYSFDDLMGVTAGAYGIFTDLDGNVWVVGKGSAAEIYFYRMVTIASDLPISFTVTGLPTSPSSGDVGPACHFRSDTINHFVFQWGDDIYAADPVTGTVTASQTVIDQPINLDTALFNLPIGARTIWVGNQEFDLADLSLIRDIDFGNWGSGYGSNPSGLYDPINNALTLQAPGGTGQAWLYLDRIDGGGVTLSTICADVAEDCGVQDYDFAALNQTVPGWSATRGAGSSILEPLLDAYDSDIRPHDFTIEGIKRTGVTTGSTLMTERFVGDPRYSITIRQSSELPRAVMIDFADVDADQQPNSVRSDRPLDATDARGEKKIDLTTLALAADEARNLADRHFRRIWNERRGVSFGLAAQNLGIEPGDVRTISLDGEELIARCIGMTVQADDVIATEWRYDSPSLALLNGGTGANFDGRAPSVVIVPLLSKGFVLDVPLISDSDEVSVPQVYTLAGPFADGTWPGATIFQAVDGEFSDEFASIPTSSAMAWGNVSGVMPYANPNLWDRGTEITVTLQTGDLTGCTEAAANADPLLNLAAIGREGRWELVQFTTATLVSGTTYTVSGFKRGRRGTEWAAELHAAGDSFVLIDTADAQGMGLSEVAQTLSFQTITAGRTSGLTTTFEFEGQTLKPYAPAHISAIKESNGDWTISAIRRTRVGGAWRGGSAIPLSEASESYRVTVGDGVTSVNKTTASLPYTWTVATQTTDTGAEVMAGNLEYAVAQISAAVGAGFVSAGTA